MTYLIPALATASLLLPPLLPTHLPPLIPLIAASFALQWYIDEYFTMSAWMRPTMATITPAQRDAALGEWFQAWSTTGGICAAIPTPLIVSSCIVSMWRYYQHGAWIEMIPMTIGLALSVYHILW